MASELLDLVVSAAERTKIARLLSKSAQNPETTSDVETDTTRTAQIRKSTRVFGLIFLILKISKKDSRTAFKSGIATSVLLTAYKPIVSVLHFLNDKEDYIKLPSHVISAIAISLTSSAHALLPRSGLRTFLSIYSLIQALEAIYKYIKLNDLLPLLINENGILKSWLLFPLAYSQIFSLFITNPDLLPSYVTKFINFLSSGYFDPKPVWYLKSWPTTTEFYSSIREYYQSLSSKSIESSKSNKNTISNFKPSNVNIQNVLEISNNNNNNNVITSLINPINEKNHLLDHLTDNFKLFKYIFPLYLSISILKYYKAKKAKKENTEADTKNLKLKTIEEVKEPENDEVENSFTKELYNSINGSIRKILFLTLTVNTSLTLLKSSYTVISKSKSKSRSKSYELNQKLRLIGFISGFWAIIDHTKSSHSQWLFLFRTALISLWNEFSINKNHQYLNNLNVDTGLYVFGNFVLMFLWKYKGDKYVENKLFKRYYGAVSK